MLVIYNPFTTLVFKTILGIDALIEFNIVVTVGAFYTHLTAL